MFDNKRLAAIGFDNDANRLEKEAKVGMVF
jgi:hypothetical protein